MKNAQRNKVTAAEKQTWDDKNNHTKTAQNPEWNWFWLWTEVSPFPFLEGKRGNFHRASILWHVCLFAEVYSVEPSSECSCVSACLSWLSTCVSLSGVAASFNRIMIFISTLLEKLLNFYAFAVWLKELQQGSLNFLKASFSPQYVM